jgi:hypothetical protein
MKIILINGMHRSGTMLLSRLINALPDTFIIKDGMRIPWFYYRVETNEKFNYPLDCYRNPEINLDLHRKVRDMNLLKKILLEELEGLNLSFELYKSWKDEIMKFKQGFSYKEVYLHLYQKLSELSGAEYVGAKNTHMFQYSPSILSTFPELKWIDIIRDSRGWYCSTKVSHKLNVFSSARLWNKAVDAIISVSDCYVSRRIVITFEELILCRTKTLQKICDFLGINFKVTEDWLNNLQLTENNGSPWYPNPSYAKSGEKIFGNQNKRKSTDYCMLDTQPVYRWNKELPLWEKIILQIMSCKNLKRLNLLHNKYSL